MCDRYLSCPCCRCRYCSFIYSEKLPSMAASSSQNSPTPWDSWLGLSLATLVRSNVLRSLRPLFQAPFLAQSQLPPRTEAAPSAALARFEAQPAESPHGFQTFHGPGPWDRTAVELQISRATLEHWLNDTPSTGEEVCDLNFVLEHASILNADRCHKLLLFSGNDYLGLSAHPTVRKAAAKAAVEFGMGPRGSALVCGYTYHHRLLESALADLKKTEECLLCPSGFAANMAVMASITSIASLYPTKATEDVIAIFSDALNHASIIDGIRVAQKHSKTEVAVYRHCDMSHLSHLLLNCRHERKVVVTDSLFSMDGDFAPMVELAALRRKHQFLLVIDDAHGTLVCGETGGGVAEAFNVEKEVDIVVGTLSKAFGCQGGFIACSRKWKQLIQSRGRTFIFSTAIPVPVVAAAHAAILIACKEKWRRQALWERVQQLSDATDLHCTSPIVPIIIGDEKEALRASRYLLQAGFHVSAIRPPTVPPNSSRLRITVSAVHTPEDVKALLAFLTPWLKANKECVSSSFQDIDNSNSDQKQKSPVLLHQGKEVVHPQHEYLEHWFNNTHQRSKL